MTPTNWVLFLFILVWTPPFRQLHPNKSRRSPVTNRWISTRFSVDLSVAFFRVSLEPWLFCHWSVVTKWIQRKPQCQMSSQFFFWEICFFLVGRSFCLRTKKNQPKTWADPLQPAHWHSIESIGWLMRGSILHGFLQSLLYNWVVCHLISYWTQPTGVLNHCSNGTIFHPNTGVGFR